MSKQSQMQRLYQWLQSGHRVTQLSALMELGIGRLGARIYDLRQRGVPVRSRLKKVETAYGATHVSEYWMDR